MVGPSDSGEDTLLVEIAPGWICVGPSEACLMFVSMQPRLAVPYDLFPADLLPAPSAPKKKALRPICRPIPRVLRPAANPGM